MLCLDISIWVMLWLVPLGCDDINRRIFYKVHPTEFDVNESPLKVASISKHAKTVGFSIRLEWKRDRSHLFQTINFPFFFSTHATRSTTNNPMEWKMTIFCLTAKKKPLDYFHTFITFSFRRRRNISSGTL
jgi:hypothetical protein